MWDDGGVHCSSMKRNSKKVKLLKSFRFSGQTTGWTQDEATMFQETVLASLANTPA
jgi:hypothetical protein